MCVSQCMLKQIIDEVTNLERARLGLCDFTLRLFLLDEQSQFLDFLLLLLALCDLGDLVNTSSLSFDTIHLRFKLLATLIRVDEFSFCDNKRIFRPRQFFFQRGSRFRQL